MTGVAPEGVLVGYGMVPPATGNPQSVAELSRSFADLADRISMLEGQVSDLQGNAHWESPAGERFTAELRQLPGVLGLIQHRYRIVSRALLLWSFDLRDAIAATRAAAEDHERAWIVINDAERDLQTALADDPSGAREQALLERRAGAVRQALAAQEAAYAAMRRMHDRGLERCAELRSVTDDAMTDELGYRATRETREFVSRLTAVVGVAALAPTPAKPYLHAAAFVGGVVTLGFDAELWLRYGDGSFGEVATSGVLAALGKGSTGMGAKAGVGSLKARNANWLTQHLDTSSGAARGLGGRAAQSRHSQQLAARERRFNAVMDLQVNARIGGYLDRWGRARVKGRNSMGWLGGSEILFVADKTNTVVAGVNAVRPQGNPPRGAMAQPPRAQWPDKERERKAT